MAGWLELRGALRWGLFTEPAVFASAWAGCIALQLISPGPLCKDEERDTALDADDWQSGGLPWAVMVPLSPSHPCGQCGIQLTCACQVLSRPGPRGHTSEAARAPGAVPVPCLASHLPMVTSEEL